MSTSLDEALKRLAIKATTLNARTSEANEIIERANQALSSMNLGVEVWLMNVSIGEGWIDTGNNEGISAQVQLGFAKVDGSWQLATRTCIPEDDVWSAPRALAKQDRDTRIRAAAHIGTLVEAITQQVDELLEASSPKTKQRVTP